ncbi:MAG: FimV/HubP family polar landmark protein [Burkholderiales bacterium]
MKFFSLTLALTIAMTSLFAPGLRAQAPVKPAVPGVYTVGKGETLVTIAAKLRHPSATENQMAYAIVRANPNAFSVRTKERLLPGAKLAIPSEATVLSYKPELADRETANLRKGETRYQDGLAAEKAGDMKGAVKAYIEAARLGHPLADLRLGQLYDKDTSKTLPRDLQESISHYQKAREFGIDVKGPTDRAPQVTKTGK